jgi:hypothetical protein
LVHQKFRSVGRGVRHPFGEARREPTGVVLLQELPSFCQRCVAVWKIAS